MASLENAIVNGFTDEEAIKGSANLEPLRKAEAYKELMAASFAPAAPAEGAAPPAEGATEAGKADGQAQAQASVPGEAQKR